ncbi:Hypothetical predicted protein [Podarcis lilfordi]|uniref:Uncharacterized protein n=1 Tax=Podarcis lilfordi TaxID=74358 RepID=A0AA35L795_9SAUR|nr:Hypothetical predicted protein [Podarcis lilfordi]
MNRWQRGGCPGQRHQGAISSFPLRRLSRRKRLSGKEVAAAWSLPPLPRQVAWALCPADTEDAEAGEDEEALAAGA